MVLIIITIILTYNIVSNTKRSYLDREVRFIILFFVDTKKIYIGRCTLYYNMLIVNLNKIVELSLKEVFWIYLKILLDSIPFMRFFKSERFWDFLIFYFFSLLHTWAYGFNKRNFIKKKCLFTIFLLSFTLYLRALLLFMKNIIVFKCSISRVYR